MDLQLGGDELGGFGGGGGGSSMAETGRLLLDSLSLNDSNGGLADDPLGLGESLASPPTDGDTTRSKRLAKRAISSNTYAKNTPDAYEVKLQRVDFLGARKAGVVPKMWSAEEDEALRAAVRKHGEKNWRVIADEIPNRNHLQCLQRWKKALRPGLVKGPWAKEEDSKLLSLIKTYTEKGTIGNVNWTAIAQQIDGRNAKQCRERWFLNLDPTINRGPWTPEEDKRLLELAAQCGGRWSLISKNMLGRTENNVKTRYHSLQRQEARNRGWTPEEDATLLNATAVFGRDWPKIVKQIPGRSRGQLKKRFTALTQHRPEILNQVQAVEDKIKKGLLKTPNPPPPPVAPSTAQHLQANLEAQQQGQRPTRPPVVSPYVPSVVAGQASHGFSGAEEPIDFSGLTNNFQAGYNNGGLRYGAGNQSRAQPPGYFSAATYQQPSHYPQPPVPTAYNSNGGANNHQYAAPSEPKRLNNYNNSLFIDSLVDPSGTIASYASNMHPSMSRTDSQMVLGEFLRNEGGGSATNHAAHASFQHHHQQQQHQQQQHQQQQPQKMLARQESTNMHLLDKFLSLEEPFGNFSEAAPPQSDGPTKSLKPYSSWGSNASDSFAALLSGTTDTTNGVGAPPIMRTGSDKKLTKMPSSNMSWANLNIPINADSKVDQNQSTLLDLL